MKLLFRRPFDRASQESFARELGRQGYADVAIARNESGQFASTARVLEEARQIPRTVEHHHSFASTAAPLQHQQFNAAYSEAAAAASSSPSSPVYVQIVEGDQMWKTIRSVVSTLALFAGLGLFLEMSGLGTGGGAGGGGAAGGRGGGGPMSIIMPRNYEIQPDGEKKMFKDVKGSNEVKKELEEVVAYLKDPSKFTKLGGKLPKGLLLTGPPGTGKTLVAKAVAGEAGVPFFYASGSEFEELYVGVGAKRVRELFAAARKKAPCIIFIDEIDAVGSSRHLKEQQTMKMTLNQLLVEMDGFQETQGIIVLAATNFPETLDPALVRPGRFDRLIAVPLPDVTGRKEILAFYLEHIPKSSDVNIDTLARATTGMSGADLANLVNVAAVSAASLGAKSVSQKHLDEALDRVMMGNERKSAVVPEEVRKVTAFHEGGHALVALRTEGAMPVHKATIVPRGHALGMVQQLPEEKDSMQMTKKQMIATLDILMAGRVAEEMIFGADNVTSGASDDLRRATKLARDMVASYGMLPNSPVGLEVVGDKASADTMRLVDHEVRLLLDASYTRVKALMQNHRRDLDAIAHALLEKETLTAAELKGLIKL